MPKNVKLVCVVYFHSKIRYSMEIGEFVARHGFVAASLLDGSTSSNTVFSPYGSFITTYEAACLCISPDQKKAIYRTLGFSNDFTPKQQEYNTLMKSVRRLMQECETVGTDSPGFLEFLEFISQKKDSPLKYLESRPLNLMYKTLKAKIFEIFPEFANIWDDEELFPTVTKIAEQNPDDQRIQDLISCTEVPLGLLRNAPFLRCFIGMWHDDGDINPKLNELSTILKVPIERLRFPTPGRQQINAKVSEWTNSKIKEIVEENIVNPVTHLILTSTVLMEARWKSPFQVSEMKSFTTLSGKEQNVMSMLQVCDDVLYFENSVFQAVELPFVGTSLACLFVLRRRLKCGPLSYRQFSDIIGKLSPQKVSIQIPRFEVGLGPKSLKPLLPDGYEGEVTDIVQQIVWGCYEDGTVPSDKDKTGKVDECETSFVANHPFLFYVRDTVNGAILLMGRITNPLGNDEEEPRKETFLTETATQGTPWEEEVKEVAPPEPVISKPPSPKPVVPDDSDLIEFVYGENPPKPPDRRELDRFFGAETKTKVTYPMYSPFPGVEFRPHPVYENKNASYEVIRAKIQVRYPRLPRLDVPKAKSELGMAKVGSAQPKFHSADSRPVKRLVYPRPTKASRLRRPL